MECILRMCIDLLALRLLSASSPEAAAPALIPLKEGESRLDEEPAQSSIAHSIAKGSSPRSATDTRSKNFLPALTVADFDSLQSHVAELHPMERLDWLRAAQFLQRALEVPPLFYALITVPCATSSSGFPPC